MYVPLEVCYRKLRTLIILRQNSSKWDGAAWTVLILFRRGTGQALVNVVMNLRVP